MAAELTGCAAVMKGSFPKCVVCRRQCIKCDVFTQFSIVTTAVSFGLSNKANRRREHSAEETGWCSHRIGALDVPWFMGILSRTTLYPPVFGGLLPR